MNKQFYNVTTCKKSEQAYDLLFMGNDNNYLNRWCIN